MGSARKASYSSAMAAASLPPAQEVTVTMCALQPAVTWNARARLLTLAGTGGRLQGLGGQGWRQLRGEGFAPLVAHTPPAVW